MNQFKYTTEAKLEELDFEISGLKREVDNKVHYMEVIGLKDRIEGLEELKDHIEDYCEQLDTRLEKLEHQINGGRE